MVDIPNNLLFNFLKTKSKEKNKQQWLILQKDLLRSPFVPCWRGVSCFSHWSALVKFIIVDLNFASHHLSTETFRKTLKNIVHTSVQLQFSAKFKPFGIGLTYYVCVRVHLCLAEFNFLLGVKLRTSHFKKS